jgi:proteasome lid subunit RPN8/RPN11
MNSLFIPETIYHEIIEYCRACYPYEACGILAGDSIQVRKFYKAANTEKSSYSYLIDAQEQFKIMKDMRENNLSLTAILHSHPASPAYPSPRDISLAFYEDSVYIIVSLIKNEPEIRGFIIKGQAEAIEVKVIINKVVPSGIEHL